ncbi:acyl-coenzyme A amino acid N-acyltransferase 1-like [Pseudophryne corroboree]|uniref:acyl-coenzyme A amino acid N-acyltransferase 1-like n=1 Tax=Pseudophryne corroboree TaxID=495146 RepID=UPI00308212D8
MIGLTVTPEISLVDEPVKIQVWGLAPKQVITLRAWLKDDTGKRFSSVAFYVSDEDGKVDLENSPATGGNFHGVCPMGLFWALKSSIPNQRLIKWDVMGSPFYVHLDLYCHLEVNPIPEGPPTATTCVERWYVSPGVKRVPIREGRVRGALFIPPGEGPFPGVIDMFGGSGGLVEFRSSLLASRGFASLALAYLAYDDLPKTLDHVDLTYFEEAAELLSRRPEVFGEGIGVVGVSKGAEIALAMASYFPQVAAAVCINGTNAMHGSTLSYGDLVLREIPHQTEKLLITYSGAYDFSRVNQDTTKPEYQDSVLPLEKARGPILFLVGEDDQGQNSLLYAKQAVARAEKYNKKDVYLQSYPGTGHLLEPPGSPFCPVSLCFKFATPSVWGGEIQDHCKAQEVSWRHIQEFLGKNLPRSLRHKL